MVIVLRIRVSDILSSARSIAGHLLQSTSFSTLSIVHTHFRSQEPYPDHCRPLLHAVRCYITSRLQFVQRAHCHRITPVRGLSQSAKNSDLFALASVQRSVSIATQRQGTPREARSRYRREPVGKYISQCLTVTSKCLAEAQL
jgi:hypothetical protein